MRVLFASDLHGEIDLYQELATVAVSSSTEVMILGGDLLHSLAAARRYEDMIPNQRDFVDQFLSSFLKGIFKTSQVKQIFLIPGNWDAGFPYLVKEPVAGIVDLTGRRFRLENGFELIGYPFVPPTPFRPKDYEKRDDAQSPWPPQRNPSYIAAPDPAGSLIPVDPYLFLNHRETIEQDLDRLPVPHSFRKAIYVMHSPPFGTNLDRIHGGGFAGSRSIRQFLEDRQPLLALHGHIHESPEISGAYVERIGQTLCLNPGQFTFGKLQAVTFDVEDVEGTLQHTCFP